MFQKWDFRKRAMSRGGGAHKKKKKKLHAERGENFKYYRALHNLSSLCSNMGVLVARQVVNHSVSREVLPTIGE